MSAQLRRSVTGAIFIQQNKPFRKVIILKEKFIKEGNLYFVTYVRDVNYFYRKTNARGIAK